jgi:zinc protease
VNDKVVFTTPADTLGLWEETVRNLTPEQLSAATRALFAGGGPLLYLTSPTPVDGGEAALRTAYEAAHRAPLSAAAVHRAKPWPYTSFGAPGAVVERRELPSLGVTAIRFKNGVRLTVKPTSFAKDQILVSVHIAHGLLDLPPERAKQAWAFAPGGYIRGGLGRIGYEDLQQALASKVYGAGFAIGSDAFLLQGATRPADLPTQLQVLAAYANDPGWDPNGWNRYRALGPTILDQLATTPGGVAARDLDALLHRGDPRWGFPTREQMAASSIEAGKAVIAGPLSSGPIEIVMVGDVTIDDAVKQVAASFGALPPRREAPVAPAARRIAFPAPALVKETHSGRADQGLAFMAWPTTDFYSNTKRARTLNVLAQVLRLRLLDEIRTKQGTTYSPQAGHTTSEVFPGYGYMAAQIEAPPEKLDGFLADAAKIAADLRDHPISEDELQRAKKPAIEALIRQQASNGWWLSELDGIQTRPEVARSLATLMDEYQSITAADLQKVARDYLVDAKAWKLEVVPAPKG